MTILLPFAAALLLSLVLALVISTEYRPGSLSFAIAFTVIGGAVFVPLFAAAGYLLSAL